MRTRLSRRAAALARRHAQRLMNDGAGLDAVTTLERAVEWQPVDESLSCDLIVSYARVGQATHALTEYHRLERSLAGQLGTSPAAATRALAERVRARRPVSSSVDPAAPAGAVALETAHSAWPQALAVLPFANLSGDAEEDYFADGMTEALITELALRSKFRVISRQSVLAFRDSRQSLREIARALEVDAVIEGSVLRDEDRVRITAQLVRVEPEAHLWASTFDRTVSSVLALHADTARSIVEAIDGLAANASQVKTGVGFRHSGLVRPPHKAQAEPRSVEPVAYEAYLKGRHFSRNLPDTYRAIAHYQRAVESDTSYAPAWAGLASAYASLAMFAYLSPADAFPPLRRALEQALALDPTHGETVAVHGVYRMLADRDWSGARRDFTRAVEQSPNSLDVRINYALFLGAMGEFDAALIQQREAATLDPIGPITRFVLAWCLYKAGQHRASIRELELILELHPHFALAYPYLAVNHALLGDAARAAEAARQSIECLPYDHDALAHAAAAFGRIGAVREGHQALERLLAIGSQRYLDPWAVGIAQAGLGDRDAAAHWFRRMYDERSPSAFCVRHDPLLDPLREHPVFREVVRRLAFPAPIR
jgi:TolB-like protein/Tfp pilus assembly protein PilF